MDKYEAADKLGVSVRTIARMVESGELAAKKVRGNRNALTYDFDPNEVERVKHEREQGEHVAAMVRRDPHQTIIHQPSLLPAVAGDPLMHEVISKLRDSIGAVSLKDKLFLTIDEASEYSGLGKWFIRDAIEDGKLTATIAGPRGSNVIRRDDLERFAQGLRSRASSPRPARSKGRAKR